MRMAETIVAQLLVWVLGCDGIPTGWKGPYLGHAARPSIRTLPTVIFLAPMETKRRTTAWATLTLLTPVDTIQGTTACAAFFFLLPMGTQRHPLAAKSASIAP